MAVALKKPQLPRRKKAAPQPAPVPVCNTCFKRLGWRDAAYCGGQKATMCKTCHQKMERKRLRGVFTPSTRIPSGFGADHIKKLTAPPAWKSGKRKAAPRPVQKAPRWVRSEKRAERYIRRKAKKAERAA